MAGAPLGESRLVGAYIVPPTVLEIIVADHCNLVCRQCNHGSPAAAKWVADPDEVRGHLGILAKVYRPRMIKMIGGEPLLHPDLAGLVAAVRASGIAPRIELVTNGTLLHRMPEAVWRSIDKLAVSVYGGTGVEAALPAWREKARAHGIDFAPMAFPEFRDTLSSLANEDEALVGRVFAACRLANLWGIHGLYRGRVYRCPQSMYGPLLSGQDFEDGIAVEDAPDFQQRLLAFLNGRTPLGSCRYCVGTVGRKAPHRLVSRAAWHADLARPPAEMIDHALLDRGLDDSPQSEECAIPVP